MSLTHCSPRMSLHRITLHLGANRTASQWVLAVITEPSHTQTNHSEVKITAARQTAGKWHRKAPETRRGKNTFLRFFFSLSRILHRMNIDTWNTISSLIQDSSSLLGRVCIFTANETPPSFRQSVVSAATAGGHISQNIWCVSNYILPLVHWAHCLLVKCTDSDWIGLSGVTQPSCTSRKIRWKLLHCANIWNTSCLGYHI